MSSGKGRGKTEEQGFTVARKVLSQEGTQHLRPQCWGRTVPGEGLQKEWSRLRGQLELRPQVRSPSRMFQNSNGQREAERPRTLG
jgi:hypothetical protein